MATESGEEKVESYLGQITAIDGNVISIALAEKPETPDGEASIGEGPSGEAPRGDKPDGQAPDGNGGTPNGDAPAGEVPSGEKSDAQAPDGEKPTGEAPDGQKPEKDMLDEMTLTLSGDTMTITVNDDTIITIDGADATPDDLQVGDTVSFFLDGEVVTSLSVGMPELTQSKQSMHCLLYTSEPIATANLPIPTIARMLTVSTGVFTAIDMSLIHIYVNQT